MSRDSWFKTGAEGVEEATRVDEDAERRRAEAQDPKVVAKKRRFWLPPDKSATITFLDTEGFYIREHNLFLDGNWLNWETCLSDFDNCPICDGGLKPSFVCIFTIIDHTEFVLRRGPNAGQTMRDQKRICAFKASARKKILRRKEQQDNDLIGCQFEFFRATRDECSTGEDFQFLRRCTADELKAFAPATQPGPGGTPEAVDPSEWIKPFDYSAIFFPKSAEELRNVIGASAPVGADGPTNTTPMPEGGGSGRNVGGLL